MAISGSRDVAPLGKPPGWTHPRAMRDWLKKIPQTERIAGAVERELHKEAQRVNGGSQMIKLAGLPTILDSATNTVALQHDPLPVIETQMNKTGLSSLVNTLRNELVSAKQDALSAGEEIASAVTEVKTVAEDVRRVAKDMHREAAEARAALGQITNGAPE